MRGGTRSVVTHVGAALVIAAIVTGCGAAEVEPTPVPTFGGPSAAGTASGGGPPDESLPEDCAEMLGVADLGALLGLPLDSVAVRTTLGVAEPSVGRTERVACRYTGTGGPVRGTLLDINVARYTDAAAAAKQWGINVDVESGERRDLPIGAASATLFERADESVLMVTYDDDTLTFILPEGPRPDGRARHEVLVDLALRVLPAVGPSSAGSPPSSSAVAPAVAAG